MSLELKSKSLQLQTITSDTMKLDVTGAGGRAGPEAIAGRLAPGDPIRARGRPIG